MIGLDFFEAFMSKKEYFLFGDIEKLKASVESLAKINGYLFTQLHEHPNRTDKGDFLRDLYHPLKELYESISPSYQKIVNLNHAIDGARNQMVKDILQAITSSNPNSSTDLLTKLNTVLSKYEIIGIDSTGPGGSDDEDNLPF